MAPTLPVSLRYYPLAAILMGYPFYLAMYFASYWALLAAGVELTCLLLLQLYAMKHLVSPPISIGNKNFDGAGGKRFWHQVQQSSPWVAALLAACIAGTLSNLLLWVALATGLRNVAPG